jgi:hypothetical protein
VVFSLCGDKIVAGFGGSVGVAINIDGFRPKCEESIM